MSEGTPEDDRPTPSGEELKRDDEGAGVGFEDKPNTLEPEEEPEATDTK